MVNKKILLSIAQFDVELDWRVEGATVTVFRSTSSAICRTDIRFVKDDAIRLSRWIASLEDSNRVGAPDIIFATLDLGMELTFCDVDDEGVTVTLFIKASEDPSRSYVGVRGRCARSTIERFGRALVSL